MRSIRKSKKVISLILVMSMVLSLFSGIVLAETGTTRIFGQDRFETAVNVAKAAFTAADTVIITRGDVFADGLAASSLASVLSAPILLTRQNELPAVVKTAIANFGATKAVVLGGEAAVSPVVVAALEASGLTVKRISGSNRFETAANIALEAKSGLSSTAFIVNGNAPADSLVAGAAAYKNQRAVLQVAKDSIPKATKDAITALGITNVYIVGGSAVVSEAVAAELAKVVTVSGRIAGDNRFATAVTFAERMFPNVNDFRIVRGADSNLADAIGASVFGKPVLYVADSVPAVVSNYLAGFDSFKHVIVGGGNAVSDAVHVALQGITSKLGAVSLTLANAISGVGSNDTVLLGTPALVQAKVMKDGAPLANATVAFSITKNAGEVVDIKGNNVVTTNALGVATVVMGTRDAFEPTDTGKVSAVEYQAIVVGSNDKATGVIKFAAIGVNDVTIDNVTNNIVADNLVRSVNSVIAAHTFTNSMVGSSVSYVNSQQVSATNTDSRKVTFAAIPSLVVPAGFGATASGDYRQDINKKSGAYGPYAVITETIPNDVPAGLLYATLNFNKIQLSQYSRLSIITKNAVTNNVINTYTVNGPHDQSNFGYQLPVQADVPIKIEVRIEAPGQVQTNMNAGFDIKDITGVFRGTGVASSSTLALPGATINWEKVNTMYSDVKYFATNRGNRTTDPDAAGISLSSLLGTDYDPNYTYSFQVPVFPFTGNAIIVGRDQNNDEKQYFLWPTVNKLDGGVFKNINILRALGTGEKAILATKDEALNSVGTITPSGSKVTVNSAAVGSTALRGTISVPGFGSDVFNATNNRVYTSVHWAPMPQATAAVTRKTVMALVGQSITVRAQLTDANGNPVAISGQPVSWSYGGNNAINAVGALGGTKATVVSRATITDVNGQATLVLSAGSHEALVESLTATATNNFKTTLKIGDETISNADLKWVAVGLDFSPVLPITPAPRYGTAATITADAPMPNAGTPWQYGFRMYGRNSDEQGFVVEGVTMSLAPAAGSVGTLNTNTGQNGVASATSNVAGISQIIGSVGQPTGEVVFKIKRGETVYEYKNVGTGTPSLYSNLILPISWKTVGQSASIVIPAGTTIAATQTSTVAYVKVTDSLGNPLSNRAVTYTITGIGATSASLTTDAHGVAAFNVQNASMITGQSVIGVNVAGITSAFTATINWVPAQGAGLVVANIGLNASGANDVLAITFSQPINPASLSIGQFRVNDGTSNYAVKAIQVSDNVVYLTMADSNAKLPLNRTYGVQLLAHTVTAGVNAGITYVITDIYGRTVAANDATLVIPSSPDVTITYNANILTITAKNGNIAAQNVEVRLVATNPALFNAVPGAVNGYLVVTTNASGVATVDLTGAPAGFATVSAYFNGVASQVFVNLIP